MTDVPVEALAQVVQQVDRRGGVRLELGRAPADLDVVTSTRTTASSSAEPWRAKAGSRTSSSTRKCRRPSACQIDRNSARAAAAVSSVVRVSHHQTVVVVTRERGEGLVSLHHSDARPRRESGLPGQGKNSRTQETVDGQDAGGSGNGRRLETEPLSDGQRDHTRRGDGNDRAVARGARPREAASGAHSH